MIRALTLAAFLTFTIHLAAGEWPRFRGPNGTGIVPAANIPVQFTEKNYNWKIAVPGVGHSCPVVWGEKLFLTSSEKATGKRIVLCVNTEDGKVLWTRDSAAKTYKTHQRNSFASSTPAVDADRLYTVWATPDLVTVVAYTHAGEKAWSADLGTFKGGHGFGISPIRVDDLLIVPIDQDKTAAVIALDAATGKQRWKSERPSGTACYSTPCLYQPDGKPAQLILTNWVSGVVALDPKTGQMLWSAKPFDANTQERSIASPVIAGDLVFATSGFVTGRKEFVALKPEGAGAKEVWRREREVAHIATPLVKGDRIYIFSEQGFATCLDAKTGKEIWQERLGGTFTSSPLCVGDHIYCISDSGDVFVLDAKDDFQMTGPSKLGEKTQATPAIADGRMFIRTEKSLISLGSKTVQ